MNVDNRSFWSFLKTQTVTVSVKPRREEPCAVFRVRNMVDLGRGRQTAMLEGYLPEETGRKAGQKPRLSMPNKIGNLDVVYTTQTITPVSHVYQVISQILRQSSTDRIVPDVLAPGDFVVFTKQ
ncbi:MAG: hypothetical protein WBK77_07415 [Alphaproteobacteria bacterium]